VDGASFEVRLVERRAVGIRLELDGEPADVRPATDGRVVDTVALRGDSYRLRLAPPPGADRAAGDGHDAGSLAAPMPGRIVRIHVAEGDHVAANEPLLVLEAMKMEHVIAAAEAGRVGRLLVDVGDQVTRGTPLVALEPSHAAGAAAGESKP
jgi:3-methylcrotonyl-CoA carboxylase alpha subunit